MEQFEILQDYNCDIEELNINLELQQQHIALLESEIMKLNVIEQED